MVYRASRSRARSGGRRVSGNRRVRSRVAVRTRRAGSSRRTGRVSAVKTVRLVIEQAAPSIAPVVGADGAYKVPDNTQPKRAKF